MTGTTVADPVSTVRHFWTRSIRRQLILGIALVHAVLMTIFVVDLVERQRGFLHRQAVAQAHSLAATLAANSTSWVLANDLAGLEEVIASQARYPGLHYAMVLSPRGEVLGHTDRRYTGRFVTDPVSARLLGAAPRHQVLIEEARLVDIAAPVLANGQLIGWARVALGQEATLAGLRVITRDGVLYTGLAIAVGIAFAWFMANGLTAALRHMVEVTDDIRRGARERRTDIRRGDELGHLAVNFNAMLDALDLARQRLAESEERFDLAMRGANDGLWDWDCTSDRVYFSPRWKEMLGYGPEEIGDHESEWSRRVHPADLAKARAAIVAHLRGRTPLYEDSHRIRHRDGSWRWHRVRGIAVRDARGHAYRMVGTATDITERKQAEDRLFEEKERALVTLNSIGDAVISADVEGRVDFLNPVAEKLTGWSSRDAAGRPLEEVFQVVHEDSREPCLQPLSQCLVEGRVTNLPEHSLLLHRDGVRETAIEDSLAPIRDRLGDIIGVVVVFHDVTQARHMAQQMSWQASHDALTGLVNRREFEHRLEELVKTALGRDKRHALMYIDLDQFKVVNDTCGHVAGDQLLRQLSFILQGHIRESDTLARLGGDEFGLLLAGCPLDRARTIADDLRQVIKEFRFTWEDKTFEVGASIGVVEIDEHADSPASLLSAADVACYAAKDLGRNRIHVYEPDDRELAQRQGEMRWVSRISDALAADRLELYCQVIEPTVATPAAPLHLEVLVRMRGEDDTLVPPSAFIPAAERFGLMPAIDRWVIRATCGTIRDYLAAPAAPPLETVAINLSGNSLSDDQLLDFVREHIANCGASPHLFCFEVTETAAIANLSQAHHFIREMNALGCRFALDDFGSGLSSFAYLKNLPVDYLKIDGSFIRDLAHDPIDRAMVRSINEVGHVMGIKTIAEFVEDQETLEHLRTIGVDYVQGYGIGAPLPLGQRLAARPRAATA